MIHLNHHFVILAESAKGVFICSATNMRENEDSQARLGMMTVTQALNKHNKQYKIIYLENCLTVVNWRARLWQDICQGFLF